MTHIAVQEAIDGKAVEHGAQHRLQRRRRRQQGFDLFEKFSHFWVGVMRGLHHDNAALSPFPA